LYPYKRAYRVTKLHEPDLSGLAFWQRVVGRARRSIQGPHPTAPPTHLPRRIIGVTHEGNTAHLRTEAGTLTLRALCEDVVQVIEGKEAGFSYSVAKPAEAWEGAAWTVEEGEKAITLRTKALTLRVTRQPVRLSLETAEGERLLWDGLHAPTPGEGVMWRGQFNRGAAFYGLGEKASRLNHAGGQFQLLNLDTAGYNRGDDPIYMSIPFFMALAEQGVVGLFFDNSYHSWVDFGHTTPDVVDYRSAGGQFRLTIMVGSPQHILSRYTELTGRSDMLPLWALGYHQCRWSYFPEARVDEIAREFRERALPCDGLHLDIHYMDDYKCFTWDRRRFPQPRALIKRLQKQGFKVLTILDPGLKVDDDYALYREGVERGMFITYPDGSPFSAPVWPGQTAFPDFSSPEVRAWYGAQYETLLDDGVDAFWNDMNEPAIITTNLGHDNFVPDMIEHEGDGHPTTHAEIRNLYGMLMARSSYEGLRALRPDKRVMLMTRSGWAGVQRYAMHWTGDNASTWDHLRLSVQMCLNLGLSGVALTGPDIGGFTGSCKPELFARWMEVGAFMPFYRVHAWLGSANQEPWSFGEEVEAISRRYLEMRYELLPYIYTAMWQTVSTGTPMMRAMAFAYPDDLATYSMDDQYLFGDAFLVAPVVEQGTRQREVYLPRGEWIDYWSGERYGGRQIITVPAPLERLPLFVKAGAVIPTWPVQQYVGEKAIDTVTLACYPAEQAATSLLYEDDGISRGSHLSDAHRLSAFRLEPMANGYRLSRHIKSGSYSPLTTHFNVRLVEPMRYAQDGTTIDAADELSIILKRKGSR
jgi:alpha-glucosidase